MGSSGTPTSRRPVEAFEIRRSTTGLSCRHSSPNTKLEGACDMRVVYLAQDPLSGGVRRTVKSATLKASICKAQDYAVLSCLCRVISVGVARTLHAESPFVWKSAACVDDVTEEIL